MEKPDKEMIARAIKAKRSLWVLANSTEVAVDFKKKCVELGYNYRQGLGKALALWLTVVNDTKKKSK